MSDPNSIMNLVHLDDEVKIKLKLNEIRIAVTKKSVRLSMVLTLNLKDH